MKNDENFITYLNLQKNIPIKSNNSTPKKSLSKTIINSNVGTPENIKSTGINSYSENNKKMNYMLNDTIKKV